jgi:hypothetical protein
MEAYQMVFRCLFETAALAQQSAKQQTRHQAPSAKLEK